MTDRPKRIQLRREKGWRKPEGAIVVARPSRWGNPFSVKLHGRALALELYGDLARGWWDPGLLLGRSDEEVVAAYAARCRWLERLGGWASGAITELRGHDLACWCPLTEPCHADILLELANAGDDDGDF